MGFCVGSGAVLGCTFGMAPSTLIILPLARVIAGSGIMASIMDHIPLANIMPFGMCNSLANPTVIAATTAALGVLTPMPCIPVTASPWMPGQPTVLVGGKPILTGDSKCMCSFGGVIEIKMPGTITIQCK